MPRLLHPLLRRRRSAIFLVLLLLLLLIASAAKSPIFALAGASIPLDSTIPPATSEPVESQISLPVLAVASVTPTATTDWGWVQIHVNEIHPRPLAVEERWGEWIELYNGGSAAVNLRDWTLQLSTRKHSIGADLIVPAGGYVLLASELNPLQNGGVRAHYRMDGMSLGNVDSLTLLAPDNHIADHVTWGNSIQVVAGRSLERNDVAQPEGWRVAWRPWPDSAGDWGSPGSANAPPPTPTATATKTPTRTPTARPTTSRTPTRTPGGGATATPRTTRIPATVTPSRTPSLTPTSTNTLPPLSAAWEWRESGSPLWIDEVGYRGDDEEFIVLANRSDAVISLDGWLLGDASYPGAAEGMVALPAVELPGGALFVVARDGEVFAGMWGRLPDAQIDSSSAPVPRLIADKYLGKGSFSLSDRGDTLLLLDPAWQIADALSFGGAGDADDAIQLHARVHAAAGSSLQRLPDAPSPRQNDQRYQWLAAPPDPFRGVALPVPTAPMAAPMLSDGYFAWWGVLGIQSNFGAGGDAFPPRQVALEAASQGIDFVAMGDPVHHPLIPQPGGTTLLAGWRWQGSDGAKALLLDDLYGDFPGGIQDRWAMLAWLDRRHPVAVWLSGDPPTIPEVSMVQVNASTLEQMRTRTLALWRARGAPLLPVPAPDFLATAAGGSWRTGVVARERLRNGLLDALGSARGWMSSHPNLYLALSAESAGGRVWMGGSIEPANRLRLRIDAGMRGAGPVTVRLWQNDAVLWEGAVGGATTVDVLAAPGSWFYLTAESNGALALSAPLLVLPPRVEQVQLTEVLADPKSDWNGDGSIDDDDEFVEFFNAGDQPVSLAGWIVQDMVEAYDGRGQFRFRAEHVIPAGAYLVLWRDGGGPVINANDEGIFLRTPGYGMADEVAWGETMPPDRSVARIGDQWYWGAIPSPGYAATWEGSMTAHYPPVDLTPVEIAPAALREGTAVHGAVATANSANAWSQMENAGDRSDTPVEITGAVFGVEGTTLWLADLDQPLAAPLRVAMPLDALGHPPAAIRGEVWRVVGMLTDAAEGRLLRATWMQRIVLR